MAELRSPAISYERRLWRKSTLKLDKSAAISDPQRRALIEVFKHPLPGNPRFPMLESRQRNNKLWCNPSELPAHSS